jgi:hypothetical protein
MRVCCPPGRGCNASERDEPCVLELCREAAPEEPEAALALTRWDDWQRACERGGAGRERRFCRRAYERARGDVLVVLLMRAQLASGARARPLDGRPAQPHGPTTRLGVLLRQHGRR